MIIKIIDFNFMEKRKLLIASHSLSEAITKCVIDNINHFDISITIVTIQEIIAEFGIFDELSDSNTIIRWFKGRDQYVSNLDHIILNRVLYVPNILFYDFTEEDKEYAQRELEAYIGFAFNAFMGVGNKSPKGVVCDVLSLPQQWKIVKNIIDINIPTYYWGPSNSNELKNNDRLVYSNIYNFMNWSISDDIDKNEHIFCFERPPGSPVFILSIGNKQFITSNFYLSNEMRIRLIDITQKVYEHFKYFIFEILIFIDKDKLYFGCVNHEIIRSCKNPEFDNFVCNNLVNEFFKCLN